MSSPLCTNKHRAKLGELIWYEENAKLYTIYPQVCIILFYLYL